MQRQHETSQPVIYLFALIYIYAVMKDNICISVRTTDIYLFAKCVQHI
jgi:hypothetical protein